MKYYARVIKVNEQIEEEVLLDFGEFQLLCFSNHCPFVISEGKTYLVDLSLTFLDDEILELSKDEVFSISRLDDSFIYKINGLMSNGNIIVNNLVFSEEWFSEDFGYMEMKFVSLVADRISVSFIE